MTAYAGRPEKSRHAAALPTMWLFTDPARTPDPVAEARRLARSTGVIYRHFGAEDRADTAARLMAVARDRELTVLIAADPHLAAEVGAHGVHWPEARVPRRRVRARAAIETAAVHSAPAAWRARSAKVDAVFVSPVFATRSVGSGPPLGVWRAASIAAACGPTPAMALGGVNRTDLARLQAWGFWGIAGIDGVRT